MIDLHGFPIGMDPDRDDFSEQSLELQSGDRLFVYSDGLTDTMRDDGEVYGAARLLSVLTMHASDDLDKTVGALLADLDKFRGDLPPSDDISILGVAVE